MTLQDYLYRGDWWYLPKIAGSEVQKDKRECDEPDESTLFAESLGRRINYGNVPELEVLFQWLSLYCEVLHENGSYNRYGDSGCVYEFSVKYFFSYAGIDYGGTTMRIEKLRMLHGESVYDEYIPVMFLHLKMADRMYDLPIYPGYNYWKSWDANLQECMDYEWSFGDIVLRVVEKFDYDTGHEDFYFEKHFSPVYVGVIQDGVNMLTDGEYLKWDSEERRMRRKADRCFFRMGEYEEKYESWSSDELRELTMEAMGYDMDEYRDNNWTDYLWE